MKMMMIFPYIQTKPKFVIRKLTFKECWT